MRKNIILIVSSIVLCLLCFFNNWYRDNIVGRLNFLVTIFFNLILFTLFVILLNITIKNIKAVKITKLNITLLIILSITLILTFYDFRLLKTKLELKLFEEERYIIIDKIKNNEFSYYYEGNIKLPVYKYISSDGEVYVYQNDEDQVISFWIFRGMMSGSIELIYSTGGETLIRKNETGHSIKKIIKSKEYWYYVVTTY